MDRYGELRCSGLCKHCVYNTSAVSCSILSAIGREAGNYRLDLTVERCGSFRAVTVDNPVPGVPCEVLHPIDEEEMNSQGMTINCTGKKIFQNGKKLLLVPSDFKQVG